MAPREAAVARKASWVQSARCSLTSGLFTLIKDRLPGGASRLAALLLPQILPVSSVVAPGDPGAARRNPVLVQREQATSREAGVVRTRDRSQT